MPRIKPDLADREVAPEKSIEERISEKLRSDYRDALEHLTEILHRSFELLWGPTEQRRSQEQVNVILGHLGTDASVIFARHKAAVNWLESIGAAEFQDEEKVSPMITEEIEGRLQATGPSEEEVPSGG